MITSRDNEKLKLVRRLQERKHRDREGLFATEGEDLLAAGLAAGAEPRFVLGAEGSGIAGEEVERALLDGVSSLGSGSRVIAVWPQTWAEEPSGPSDPSGLICVYLHGLGDPGNVGTVIRSLDALAGGSVALGPGCADPFSPKAVRASMGAVFTVGLVRCELDRTPQPRIAMVAEGGEAPGPVAAPVTLCMGAEREGLPADVVAGCERRWTIPMRPSATGSLNVAAAAAIALERISSGARLEGAG